MINAQKHGSKPQRSSLAGSKGIYEPVVRLLPTVERPAPGKAPTAFRIGAHGPNPCDGNTVVFSERSAGALLAEQTARGRLYSFDFDHRSTMPDVSPEAGKAAGWHVLEVRLDLSGKPELWASSCDWTPEARAGIETTPPEWRYFSPCYEVDPKTREVVSYVGCALTNNPLTHGIPALASAAGRPAIESGRLTVARLKVRELVARSRRMVVASSRAAAVAAASTTPATPEELIKALGVVVNPSAVEGDKAKALDMLAAHFDALHTASEKKTDGAAKMKAAAARVQAIQARLEKTEAASAARSKRIQNGRPAYGDARDPIAFAIDTAVGNRRHSRGDARTKRTQELAPSDPVLAKIEQAQRNSSGGRR